MESRRIVVIGGGIAGLTAAHRIATRGGAVTLLERDTRVGGKIVTERADGFLIEGGPDAFMAMKPWGRTLCDELGVGLVGSDQRTAGTFVMRDGALFPLPDGLSGVIPRRFSPVLRSALLSPRGKARLALEWAVPRRRDPGDESLAAFVRRRAGREAWDRLVEPLVAGPSAGDGERLSLPATFPVLAEAERDHGGLVRAGIAARRAGRSQHAGPPFLTTADGLGGVVGTLVDAVAAAGGTVRTGAEVTGLERDAGRWRVHLTGGEVVGADAVVVAAPAGVAGRLLHCVDRDLAADLHAIPYVATVTITLAYPVAAVTRPLDGHAYFIPRREGSPIVACSVASARFPGRGKPGWVLLRAFAGRHGGRDLVGWSDDELVHLAGAEFARTLGVRGEPAVRRVFRWPEAIPQYVLGHRDRVARISQRVARLPGLALAGAAYDGVGIPDCIRSGSAAAESALADVAGGGS